ncbi:aspartate kinase [Pseudoalteromonas aurantia]|uniref:Aspartokinase n=1 Tax=Pseudoalteromonas aurantia TaxID=43654 RepID=A0A5S3VDD5_9GAMM|nr:aspartate kinase [Pseudoalteromonas aurantia]TMO63714.1 aspartate kinase [Pseudoalteromonas aurantia]TMO70170.1 aspartate kinase [Pseudoalteromonas aurantia]TMO77468.1 aspartate kinase [Pseudoalteromonas aurantia]
MALFVQKFGGTSVGSLERIEAVAELVVKTRQQGHQVVVVLSAMSGETNRLIGMARQLDTRPNSRELDVLLTTGEQVSVALLAMAIIKRGHSAISLLADQVGIQTSNHFGKAQIECIHTERLKQELEHNRIAIIAGFQGRDNEGNITTLGRGGTDTTAVELAAALKADECQIFTDVDGVYTTDPRIDSNARRLAYVTCAEMLALASLGAKVLHLRSVEAAGRHKVPLRVLSSFFPDAGTLITYEENSRLQSTVSGIAASRDEVQISVLSSTQSTPKLRLIEALCTEHNIEIDMITQTQQHSEKIGYAFTVHSNDHLQVIEILQSNLGYIRAHHVESNMGVAKVSAVGLGIKSNCGVTEQFFSALAQEGIKTLMNASSEIKVSVVVEEKYLELAVRTLHATFFSESTE